MKRIMLALLMSLLMGTAGIHAQNPLPDIPGHIAYIGVDQNVHVVDLLGNSRLQLTTDAGISGTAARLYQWPTWSADGRLAYFGTTVTSAGTFELDVYVTHEAGSAGELLYSAEGESFTYAAWSPQNCTDSENCRDLAVLISSEALQSFQVTVIRDAEEPTSFISGTGAPFYFSWSPNGEDMVWHRDNARVDVFNLSTRSEREITSGVGAFFAPAWSPVDDRLLMAIAGTTDQSSSVAVIPANENETQYVLGQNLPSPLSFSWSPDGNRIAFIDGAGTLSIIDAVTGTMVAGSERTGVLAFFWSPNSSQVAFVTLDNRDQGSFSAKLLTEPRAAQVVPGLFWSVIDLETSSVRQLATFRPTREMAYLLTYFDQFAQSHRIWSPDSRHLVYSEVTQDGTPVISVLDTFQQTSALSLSVAQGVIGIWSIE